VIVWSRFRLAYLRLLDVDGTELVSWCPDASLARSDESAARAGGGVRPCRRDTECGGTIPPPGLEAPDKRAAIFFFETPAKTLVTIELDERLRFYFGRRAPDMPAAYAVADGSSLVGMERVDILCSWTPLGSQIRVTNLESGDSVSSEQAG
jgi:hypothetical protein